MACERGRRSKLGRDLPSWASAAEPFPITAPRHRAIVPWRKPCQRLPMGCWSTDHQRSHRHGRALAAAARWWALGEKMGPPLVLSEAAPGQGHALDGGLGDGGHFWCWSIHEEGRERSGHKAGGTASGGGKKGEGRGRGGRRGLIAYCNAVQEGKKAPVPPLRLASLSRPALAPGGCSPWCSSGRRRALGWPPMAGAHATSPHALWGLRPQALGGPRTVPHHQWLLRAPARSHTSF